MASLLYVFLFFIAALEEEKQHTLHAAMETSESESESEQDD
jgi:hypothetical protein